MKGRRALAWVLVPAAVGIGGILGLLFMTGVWDGLLLALAAVPLAVGLWRWRAQARRGIGRDALDV